MANSFPYWNWRDRLVPLVGVAVAAASLWAAARWWKQPLKPLMQGLVAVITADGWLNLFSVAGNSASAPRLVLLNRQFVAWVDEPEALEIFADEAFLSLSMRGDQGAIAVCEQEIGSDFIDTRITIWNARLDAKLFFTTDNFFPAGSGPQGAWMGRDPASPRAMREAQASADAAFAQDPDNNSGEEFVARYSDDADGELGVLGWTSSGHLLIAGKALFQAEVGGWNDTDDMQEWWRVVGLRRNGGWGTIAEGNDAPPIKWFVVRRPPLTLDIELKGSGASGALWIDGVKQTNPELAAGVLAFAGPYR